MERYEGRQATFDGRGSFSKTDPDATFMRMKDDHMGNGQLKAAHNVQAGTENQFVVDTTVHRRPGDTACAIPHLEHVKARLGALPGSIVADAGYGSEENYSYLEAEGVEAFVKHSEFYRERRNRAWREDEMRPANWEYDEDVNVNLSFATFANANSPIAPTHFHRSRQRQAPLPASLSGARSLVR